MGTDLSETRRRLAGLHAQFVATLVGGADNVLGLNETHLAAARASLLSKRLKVLGHPGLYAGVLAARANDGTAWRVAQTWHVNHPPTSHGADAASLLFELDRAGALPPEARFDFLTASAAYGGRRLDTRAGQVGARWRVWRRRGPFAVLRGRYVIVGFGRFYRIVDVARGRS